MNRLINMGLRGMTLASKFLLIVALAGFLEPHELGLYGLVAATIAYAIYPLGFDFYSYSTRELLKLGRPEWGGVLKSQAVFHLIMYVIGLPAMLVVFALDLLPWYLAVWFFVLLVLEHLNQELIRLLVAISEQLTASWVLFFRSGGWALAVTLCMFVDSSMRSLEVVLTAWGLGGVMAVVLAVYRFQKLKLLGWSSKIKWRWMIKGLKVAIPILIATLAIRAVFTIDRYWFEALQGLEVLGAYVLFMGIANALMSFLDAGVFSFSYPSLIAAYNRGNFSSFQRGVRRLLWQTVVLIVTFIILAWLVIEPLLIMLEKQFYLEQLVIFPWVLAAMALYALSMVPHYALYSQGQDRPIILSHLGAVVIFISTTWMLSQQLPEKAVLLGLVTTFTVLLIWKALAFYRLTPRQYR